MRVGDLDLPFFCERWDRWVGQDVAKHTRPAVWHPGPLRLDVEADSMRWARHLVLDQYAISWVITTSLQAMKIRVVLVGVAVYYKGELVRSHLAPDPDEEKVDERGADTRDE